MRSNPYQSPSSRSLSTESSQCDDATKWRRFANFAIDYFLVVVIWFAILFVLETLWLEFRRYDFHTENPPNFPPKYDKDVCAAIATVLAGIVSAAYFLFAEWTFGRTIGKLLTRSSVVDESGQRASFKQIVKRTAIRFIPWDCLTFLKESSRGWHDKFSKTTVIHSKKTNAG